MSRLKHKDAKTSYQTVTNSPSLKGNKIHLIMLSAFVLIVCSLFFKIAFLDYAPPASDTMQWRGSAQQILEYNKDHWLKAQWTDNMFAGMPSYLISFRNQYYFVDIIFTFMQKLIDWRIFFLLFAGIGMYILLCHLKFDPMIALLGAISFALSCHFIGLIEIGHNTKFKAIMYIPWIFWAIDYLRQNKNILGLGLSSVFIIQQLRENHIQISYYTFLLIGIYWLVYAIDAIKKKEFKSFGIYTISLFFVFILAGLAVSNPYMNTAEYSKYTIRGGAEGLSKEYATGWSFGVGEVLTFIVPKFYGGISPYYWGPMSFTQTSMYMGIGIFFLMMLAIVFVRNKTLTALTIGSIFTILLSFGKEFPLVYDLFFKFVPGFNKFRVPAMILVLIQFAFVVMAAYALDYIIKNRQDKKLGKFIQYSLYGSIALFILFIIGKGIFSSLSFVKPDELQQYQSGQLEQLKAIRLELLVKSGMQSAFILILSVLAIWAFLKEKLNKCIMLGILMILCIIDLSLINKDHLKSETLVKEKEMFSSFENNAVDNYLLQDKDTYRIFPLAREFGNARWSYNHQSLGGYHGAKLKRYQDIIENSLHAELVQGIPLNWNIINMLNTKYIIFNNQLPLPNLEEVFYDQQNGLYVFKNLSVLPRAWFVKKAELISQPEQIFSKLNSPSFNPAETAIVEEQVPAFSYSDSSSVKMLDKDLHQSKWEVNTPVNAFMTISEIYYPAGWKVFIDGKETKIYPVNYILRGVEIPAGKHHVEMKFVAETYQKSIIMSGIGLALSLILTITGVIIVIKKRKNTDTLS
ncbi:MAG: YfhO family protein [Candidatus Cloacimonetes bacterium]|nr:YfhO family protein [Candidatus Cloacimonadota bacterium]